MPLKTESGRRPAVRLKLVPLFIIALLAPVRLAAQGTTVYVDIAAAGLGTANGALHLRWGLELPVEGPWSAVIEPGLYSTGTRDMLSLQLDLSGSARWRPAGPGGFFTGVGAGIAAAGALAAPWATDPAAYSLLGLKAFALAEAGWSFGKASSPIRVEPYIRSAFAVGPEIPGGTAFEARQGPEWGSVISVSAGLRLVWMPCAR